MTEPHVYRARTGAPSKHRASLLISAAHAKLLPLSHTRIWAIREGGPTLERQCPTSEVQKWLLFLCAQEPHVTFTTSRKRPDHDKI